MLGFAYECGTGNQAERGGGVTGAFRATIEQRTVSARVLPARVGLTRVRFGAGD
jgi:hypothetical protein